MTRARRRRPHGQKIVIHRPKGSTCELGAPEPYPLRALVVNLDAAKNTGVAVYIAGRLRAYDEVDATDPHARARTVRECIAAAEVRALPLVMCVEAPWGGYVSAALSLTSTVSLWRDTWRALQCDAWHFVELTAGQWRRAIIGRGSMTREASRAWEAVNARARVIADVGARPMKPIGPDAAAAICMGQATSRSSGVRKRLGCDLVRTPATNERKATNT